MYGMFTYIWLKYMANVGKYSVHAAPGNGWISQPCTESQEMYIVWLWLLDS